MAKVALLLATRITVIKPRLGKHLPCGQANSREANALAKLSEFSGSATTEIDSVAGWVGTPPEKRLLIIYIFAAMVSLGFSVGGLLRRIVALAVHPLYAPARVLLCAPPHASVDART